MSSMVIFQLSWKPNGCVFRIVLLVIVVVLFESSWLDIHWFFVYVIPSICFLVHSVYSFSLLLVLGMIIST